MSGVVLIGVGIYSLYDANAKKPKSTGGKMWQIQGVGAGILALLLGALIIISEVF